MDGDILHQIDQAVDDAREQHCACGCGTALTEHSASFYYASQDCQSRAMRAVTTDPHEVENRSDYSFYSLTGGYSDAASTAGTATAPGLLWNWMREEIGGRRRRPARDNHAEFDGWRELGWIDHVPGEVGTAYIAPTGATMPVVPRPPRRSHVTDDQAMVDYRFVRQCPHCDHIDAPTTVTDNEVYDAWAPPVRALRTTRQGCPQCRQPYALNLQATWSHEPDRHRWVLRVQDDNRFVQRIVSDRELDLIRIDRASYIQRLWVRMAEELQDHRWGRSDTTGAASPGYHNPPRPGPIRDTARRFRLDTATVLQGVSSPLDDVRHWMRQFSAIMEQSVPPVHIETPTLTPAQLRAAAAGDTEPGDPRARALWLRRRRNTGPDRSNDVHRTRRSTP